MASIEDSNIRLSNLRGYLKKIEGNNINLNNDEEFGINQIYNNTLDKYDIIGNNYWLELAQTANKESLLYTYEKDEKKYDKMLKLGYAQLESDLDEVLHEYSIANDEDHITRHMIFLIKTLIIFFILSIDNPKFRYDYNQMINEFNENANNSAIQYYALLSWRRMYILKRTLFIGFSMVIGVILKHLIQFTIRLCRVRLYKDYGNMMSTRNQSYSFDQIYNATFDEFKLDYPNLTIQIAVIQDFFQRTTQQKVSLYSSSLEKFSNEKVIKQDIEHFYNGIKKVIINIADNPIEEFWSRLFKMLNTITFYSNISSPLGINIIGKEIYLALRLFLNKYGLREFMKEHFEEADNKFQNLVFIFYFLFTFIRTKFDSIIIDVPQATIRNKYNIDTQPNKQAHATTDQSITFNAGICVADIFVQTMMYFNSLRLFEIDEIISIQKFLSQPIETLFMFDKVVRLVMWNNYFIVLVPIIYVLSKLMLVLTEQIKVFTHNYISFLPITFMYNFVLIGGLSYWSIFKGFSWNKYILFIIAISLSRMYKIIMYTVYQRFL